MWRPVALTAFLALLFMSSRSGQPPVETNTNDLAKMDFGASATREQAEAVPQIEIDLAQSSAHQKMPSAQQSAENAQEEAAETSELPVTVASAAVAGSRTIPLPEPKADVSGARVVVTQGEQKTALTTGEEALRLMPPGPDFAAKVQRELARLGCYRGRVDNIWGPMSRNAVARFNRVANGKLPLKQPTRALLGSARNAPDNYCNGGGSGSRVASLDPGAGLEALKERPAYLPPWMRGEPMPDAEPQEEQAEAETEAKPSPGSSNSNARQRRAKPQRTQRARSRTRQVRRRQVRRRAARRSTRSFGAQMDSRGSFWPGQ
jgi:hypothetical protein